MTGGLSRIGYDSAALAAAERFASYRDLYSAGAEVTEIGPGFAARMTGWKLDRALLYDRVMANIAHERGPHRAGSGEMDHFTLTLLIAGELHVDGGSGYRRLAPGDIMLLDMTRPTRNRAPAAHIVTLSMARDRIARLAREPRRLHGQVIAAARGALLAEHMRSIARHGALLTPAALMTISRVTSELLGAALADKPDGRTASSGLDEERTDRVRAFIEERLFEPGFGPDAVIAQFGRSRATLYRDFQPWGGLASYIRVRRGEALRDRLADSGERRSLAELADAIGFSTEARLSEAFLGQFGMRPGAYRQTTRHEPPPLQSIRSMREWQNELR